MAHVEQSPLDEIPRPRTPSPARPAGRPGRWARGRSATRLRWYREVAIIVAFYTLYSMSRNLFGSNAVSPAQALENAGLVIRFEKLLHSYFEADLQQFFLGWGGGFMRLWNLFYGSLHFVVTPGVLIWLFRCHPERYTRWRNTLAATTGMALVGFSMFPLMPPRLLAATGPYGGHEAAYAGAFVDSLERYPALWSFNSATMQSVSNQYAAMPSLHVGWALWCVLAVYPLLRARWTRGLYLLYVPATVFTIVVTANHYWLDAAGGAVGFGVGYLIAGRIERLKVLGDRRTVGNLQTATALGSEAEPEALVS